MGSARRERTGSNHSSFRFIGFYAAFRFGLHSRMNTKVYPFKFRGRWTSLVIYISKLGSLKFYLTYDYRMLKRITLSKDIILRSINDSFHKHCCWWHAY